MGVTYKLKDEVVHFIINQRQSDPLSSCRQLAESASQEFGLQLSKSSVHEVLKESGIITPRGRKPRLKFTIPQEKKKQIQESLSQVKLLTVQDPLSEHNSIITSSSVISDTFSTVIPESSSVIPESSSVIPAKAGIQNRINSDMDPRFRGDDNKNNDGDDNKNNDGDDNKNNDGDDNKNNDGDDDKKNDKEVSPVYEGAGRIFLKAALWDLGIFSPSFFKEGLGEFNSEGNIKETDWNYFLTYSKGIKVVLENNKDFFIDLPLPIERCIKETADGLINNVKPFIVNKVSDEVLFKACMDDQERFKIRSIAIVDYKDRILLELDNIMEHKRTFIIQNRVFVENKEKNALKRAKTLFFPSCHSSVLYCHSRESGNPISNNDVIDNILNLKGFDTTSKDENVVTLLIDENYANKAMLQEAIERLNGMYIRDEQDRLVKVKIQVSL
jgi:hypothetical protein